MKLSNPKLMCSRINVFIPMKNQVMKYIQECSHRYQVYFVEKLLQVQPERWEWNNVDEWSPSSIYVRGRGGELEMVGNWDKLVTLMTISKWTLVCSSSVV